MKLSLKREVSNGKKRSEQMKLFFLFFLSLLNISCVENIDSGQEVLFKKGYSSKIMEYQSFPMSSWAYVVTNPDYEFSKKQLDLLGENFSVILDKENARGMNLLLEDWVLDGVFLDQAPESLDKFEDDLRASLLKAQFLEMFNQGGFKYVKADPLGRSERFLNVWSKSFQLNESKGGEEAKYKFTPVLPFSPSGLKMKINWGSLETLFEDSKEGQIIGADYFAKENKAVIMKDLKFVALVGGAFGLLLLAVLFYFSLYKVLFFLPVIGLSMWVATWVLVGVLGSIHGLVLSFGTSIVGLSLDYAIHAVHARDKKKVWRKNLIALGTTLLAFGGLCFSTVPLFKGIALFSIFGLLISFIFMYFFDLKFSFHQKSLSGGLGKLKIKISKIGFCAVFAMVLLLIPFAKYNRSLKPFMYTPEAVKPIMETMKKDSSEVLVKVSPLGTLKTSEERDLASFSLSSFTKSLDTTEQRENAESWKKILEAYNTEDFKGFFKDYVLKARGRIKEEFDLSSRFYASLFVSGDREISILKTKSEEVKARAEKLGFWSPSTVVDEMGDETLKELLILFGAALLVSIFGLWFLMKDLSKVVKIFFPFTVFLLFFFLLSLALGIEVNLIHVIGVLIVFGISLDYGVFGAEASEEERAETFSSFNLSAISTLFGFTPLVLAAHPVLQSLGLVLVTGIVGSYLGGLILIMQTGERSISHNQTD